MKSKIEQRRELGKNISKNPRMLEKGLTDIKKMIEKKKGFLNETKAKNRHMRE